MKDIMRANPDGSPVIIGVWFPPVPVFRGLREPPIQQSFEHSRIHDKDRATLRSALLSEKLAFSD
jgi:hypothetical protein